MFGPTRAVVALTDQQATCRTGGHPDGGRPLPSLYVWTYARRYSTKSLALTSPLTTMLNSISASLSVWKSMRVVLLPLS